MGPVIVMEGLLEFYFCGEGGHRLPRNRGCSKLRTLPSATRYNYSATTLSPVEESKGLRFFTKHLGII